MQTAAMEKRVINGVEIAYRIGGEPGGRPIMLIHGLTASMRDWVPATKAFVDAGWRVLTPDCPGHGDSASPGDPNVYEMMHVAVRLHALAVETGFAPAAIVGHSMGGAIAEEYAIRYPADVSALVLVASAGGSQRPYQRTPDMDAFAAEERALAFERGMEAVWALHQERGTWLSARHRPPIIRTYLKTRFCRCSPQGYIYGGERLHARRNTIEDLKTFSKKALIVCGENEEKLMQGTSAELAAALPNATAVMIPEAGHSPQFENASAFNAALLDFLKDVPTQPRRPEVRGVDLDSETRCAHWHSSLDVIAIKMKCCGIYYACKDCHDELAGHASETWPRAEWSTLAVLCGVCGTQMSVETYLGCGNVCPSCGARFNPGCRNHYHFYFADT